MLGIPVNNLPTSFRRSYIWLVFIGILIGYAFLVVPTVDRLGIGWDEATDFEIAQKYRTPWGLLLGSTRDPSQARLPMFIGAVVFYVWGESNLILARYLSVLVGGLTLLGIFVYGKDRFSPAIGLLAAGLLAINPFFLSFARMAFTESDIYLSCTLTWLLVILSRLQEKSLLGWAVLAGICLGLAISSKATMLLVVPVVVASYLLCQIFHPKSATESRLNALRLVPAYSIWFWSAAAFLILAAGVLISNLLNLEAYSGWFHVLNYSLVWIFWLTVLAYAVRNRDSAVPPMALPAFIVSIGLLTFIVIPPEHLTNSVILHKLISRADQEMTFSPGFMMELAALHFFIVLLKSTPVLGVGLIAGYAVSLRQWHRPGLTLPLMIGSAYLAALLVLPLGQTFYTIPLLPIFSLLTAVQLMRLISKSWRISLTLIVLGLILWGVEVILCYPDYHLNGYQWLGARPFFGRSSIGYRSIVFLPSDGVQQSVEWVDQHVKAGQIVQLYVGPWHIVRALAPDPAYQIVNGLSDRSVSRPDYIMIEINSTLWPGEGSDTPEGSVFLYPVNIIKLQSEYEKVFSVQRAYGIEMASVWKRK